MIWLLMVFPFLWVYSTAMVFAPIPTLKITAVFCGILYGFWWLLGLAG